MLKNLLKKTRSFSQTSLQTVPLDTSSQKKVAKVKLQQLKKAKEKIEKVYHSDLKAYQIYQENFHNKKDYFCNKESSLISDLFETNRLYKAEQSRSENPLSVILSDPQAQAFFFETLKREFTQMLRLFKGKNSVRRYQELTEEKMNGFQQFFQSKVEENRRNEEQRMLIEDIKGKVMRNFEYATALEDCETRLSGLQAALAEIRKESLILNLSGELPDYNQVYKERKNKRNELVFNIKVSEENLRGLKKELDGLRKKGEGLMTFISQIEMENCMKEFEESLKNCISGKESALDWFLTINREVFGYDGFFNEINGVDLDEMQQKQDILLEKLRLFPNIGKEEEVYEVILEGAKKNKHFNENLAVFFEFRRDIFEKIKVFCEPFQRKLKNFEAENALKNELIAELDKCERSILLIEAENSRNNNSNNSVKSVQNTIKIRDLLNVSSQEKELQKLIEESESEIRNLEEKRTENQKLISLQVQIEKSFAFSEKEEIIKVVSRIYQALIDEKLMVQELKENTHLCVNSSESESLFELFYAGLNRNFHLLENDKKREPFHETNLDLYRQKLDFLSNRLEKTKSEHLQEMCQMNEKILSQQLKIEKDEERIRTLERFIQNLKQENSLKTTQNTKKTEEEEAIYSSNEIYVVENKAAKKNRHKSFSFVKQSDNLSRFGNVCINLLSSQDSFQTNSLSFCENSQKSMLRNSNKLDNSLTCSNKNLRVCDFPCQLPKANDKKSCNMRKKVMDSEVEIYKLAGNDKISDCSKSRVLKILEKEKKIEILKKYELAGKEKVAVENSFGFNDFKRFEVEVYSVKNKKEAIFRLEVAFMGMLRVKTKEYEKAKELKSFFKEIGVEEKEMKKMR